MVVGAFPIAKLSVLLVKQISKPIANICKERAKNSPFFRTYVCMPPAQFYNWCEVKAKMWILNLGKPVNIPVLSQDMAIELGANLLGEGLIFTIGAALLIIEYNRQSKKESAKEAKREYEMNEITSRIRDLYFSLQQQETQLREMERIVLGSSPLQPITPPSKTPLPSGTPAGTPQNLNNVADKDWKLTSLSTPYPNRGIILSSLNYIQMDVLSSSIFCNNDPQMHHNDENSIHHREPALLTETLQNIENEFRSLF